ncbi:MAG: hypothetical protein AMJ66_04530 [Betaproteobacteria bacterium SG8_40]|jgi:hypothetical protein|nr:MAG: hypothetical protein AMJ66_04530 [Betaproteobacteria bacterium SG8_40]
MSVLTQPTAALNRLSRYFVIDTFEEALDLLRRYREVDSFNAYVNERALLVIASVLVQFLIGIGCVMSIVTLLPDVHWLLVLPVLLCIPLVLAGAFLVQTYVFFSWIEGRSMERALGSRRIRKRGKFAGWIEKHCHLDIGPSPRVPWVLSTLLLFAPFLLLAYSWLPAAGAVLGLGILMPIVYAALDR